VLIRGPNAKAICQATKIEINKKLRKNLSDVFLWNLPMLTSRFV
jgi:hypothetical protein